MSYNLEGKIANQIPNIKFDNSLSCEKCKKIIDKPVTSALYVGKYKFNTYSYIGTDQYIYETKSGRSVVYCSKYCMKRHNHRNRK